MKTSPLFSQPAAELSAGIQTQGFSGQQLMVTRLIFASGAVGTSHSHPHEQLTIVLRGSVEMTMGDERQVLNAGDAVSIPSNVVHGVVALEETEMIDVFTPLRTDLIEKLHLPT